MIEKEMDKKQLQEANRFLSMDEVYQMDDEGEIAVETAKETISRFLANSIVNGALEKQIKKDDPSLDRDQVDFVMTEIRSITKKIDKLFMKID